MDTLRARRIRVSNETLLINGQLDLVEDFFAPDYVARATEQDVVEGPSAIRKYLGNLREAFSDLEVEILVESGDSVALAMR